MSIFFFIFITFLRSWARARGEIWNCAPTWSKYLPDIFRAFLWKVEIFFYFIYRKHISRIRYKTFVLYRFFFFFLLLKILLSILLKFNYRRNFYLFEEQNFNNKFRRLSITIKEKGEDKMEDKTISWKGKMASCHNSSSCLHSTYRN